MTRSTRAALGALALAALIALAGCAAVPLEQPTQGTGPVTGSNVVGQAAWLANGRAAALLSMGSSSCVPKRGEVIGSQQTITANFSKIPADTMCTTDLAPRASYIPIPNGVDPHQNVIILAFGGLTGSLTLPALSTVGGADGLAPSAGWFEGNHTVDGVPAGSFAFLTYGSSTCAPAVKSVTATSPSTVTLTLAEPSGVSCTTDMVPRVGYAVMPDTVVGSDVTVTFEGAGVSGVTQMLGTR